MTSISTCNNDCTCIISDCPYNHPIDFPNRKIVYNLYNKLQNPCKIEENPEMRKKNCNFGKLCRNRDCGFRHRLNFKCRGELIEKYENHQLMNTKKVHEKPKKEVKEFSINTSNPFDLLCDVEVPVVVINEMSNMDFKVALLKDDKEKRGSNNWADMCENDDFLMKF